MHPTELHGFLRSRRSTRRFQDRPISRAVIERVLTTATFAPSAHNRQPWRFAVISTTSGKERLAAGMAAEYERDLSADGMPLADMNSLLERSRVRILSTPLIVVLCMNVSDMDGYPDARRTEAERIMALQSTANAATTLLLAVHAEGLGGVWNCGPLFAPHAVISALDLPAAWEPQGMLLIGEPAAASQARCRKPVEEVAVFL